jgi:serine/threonine protein kinase
MAPEQARGAWAEVDAQSDLWSMGALMHRLLTGRALRPGATASEVLKHAATEPAPRVAHASPEIPFDVARVVDRALAYHKAARWKDARAMQRAVREAIANLTPVSGIVRRQERVRRPFGETWRAALLVLVAALVLGALAILVARTAPSLHAHNPVDRPAHSAR